MEVIPKMQQDRSKPRMHFRFKRNSRQDGHLLIRNLRKEHIREFIQNRNYGKDSLTMCKGKMYEKLGKVEYTDKIEETLQGLRIATAVIGSNGSYYVTIVLDKKVNTEYGRFHSSRDILESKCNCLRESSGKYKKCSHVAAFLLSIVDTAYINQPMKSPWIRKHAWIEEKEYYKICDIQVNKSDLPNAYPGPEFAFLLTNEQVLRWLTDDKGNLAAFLQLVYAGPVWINPLAPECTSCKQKMEFSYGTESIRAKSSFAEWKCGRCKTTKHISSCLKKKPSETFEKAVSQSPSKLIRFILNYFNPGPAPIKSKVRSVGLVQKKIYDWAAEIRKLCGIMIKQTVILLGDNGSTVEFDGTYFKRTGRVWFRMIERDRTTKNQHRMRTFPVKAESAAQCLPLILKFVEEGTALMADGCGFGRNKQLNEIYPVRQCNHSLKIWSITEPGHDTVHGKIKINDNLVENSFGPCKIQTKVSHGLWNKNSNPEKVNQWASQYDWENNYTSHEQMDMAQTFLEMVGNLTLKTQ